MAFYTFTQNDQENNLQSTFRAETLTELIDQFDMFVRGCGYVPVGEIKDVVDDDLLKIGLNGYDDDLLFMGED